MDSTQQNLWYFFRVIFKLWKSNYFTMLIKYISYFHLQYILLIQNKSYSSIMRQSLKQNPAQKLKYQDFQVIKTIGVGAYGKVQLVVFNGKQYALKIVEKRKLQKEGKEYMAFVQRQILMKLSNPGIIKLYTCFQDSKNVYYLLQYCQSGNLKNFIQQNFNQLTQEIRKLYTAEVAKIIQYLQSVKIVHRDLKPENILIHSSRHLKINDFGTTQYQNCSLISDKFKKEIEKQKNTLGYLQPSIEEPQIEQKSDIQVIKTKSNSSTQQNQTDFFTFYSSMSINKRRKATFVGTCNYVPPELLQFSQCGFASDIWALGCVIFELYYGSPPFDAENEYQIFEKIKEAKISFPKNGQITQEAKDLITKILKKNPEDRLGCNSRPGLMLSDLFQHQYFKGMNLSNFNPQNNPIPKIQKFQQKFIGSKNSSVNKIKNVETLMLKYIRNQNKSEEDIVYSGIVEKRTFINYNTYYLVLMKDLTLYRIKIEQPEKQCIIPIKQDLPMYTYPAQLIESNMFELASEQKKYKFRTQNAEKWIYTINNLFQQKIILSIANRKNTEKNNMSVKNTVSGDSNPSHSEEQQVKQESKYDQSLQNKMQTN